MKLKLKDGTKIAGMIGIGVFIMFFNFIAATLIMKFGWEKISLILFPGLVENGDVNAYMSFIDAFTITVIIYALKTALGTGIAKVDKGKDNK